MSLQEQPMQQQQQPMSMQQQPMQQQPVQQVYPTTVTYQSPPDLDHHSNGSFGSVFVVLAIIIVISAIACCLGRLCGRRGSGGGNKAHNQKQVKPHKQQQNYQNSRPKEVDIEFGFDKKIAASKPMNNGHGHGHGHGQGQGHGNGNGNGHGHGAVRGVHKPPQQFVHGGDMRSFDIKLGPPPPGKFRL